jgi:hypothetical protein
MYEYTENWNCPRTFNESTLCPTSNFRKTCPRHSLILGSRQRDRRTDMTCTKGIIFAFSCMRSNCDWKKNLYRIVDDLPVLASPL